MRGGLFTKKETMKFKPGKSDKKKLREKIGVMHYHQLLTKRGPMCEICGQRKAQGRFHILSVGAHPRLEFVEENILLSCWMPCHFDWHHSFEQAKVIEKRIIALRGPAYRERLLAMEVTEPKHSMTYLAMLHEAFKQEVVNG